MGLLTPEVMAHLSGEVVPFAVPAEEFIEVEQRLEMRKEGKLEFLGGKQELIRLGKFDDVDIAMMCHTTSDPEEGQICMSGTNNGIVAKRIQFLGRGAHAGAADVPQEPPTADAWSRAHQWSCSPVPGSW